MCSMGQILTPFGIQARLVYTRRYIFYSGLDMGSALELGVAAGGWFACVNATEEREILDSHLENSFFTTDRSEPVMKNPLRDTRVSQHMG